MKVCRYIVFVATVALLCGCGSAQNIPVDDAYHWSDETATQSTQTTKSTEPAYEYINIQDTTVTIRINR